MSEYKLGYPDSKVHGANMGPTRVLSAPGGPHIGPTNLAFRVGFFTLRNLPSLCLCKLIWRRCWEPSPVLSALLSIYHSATRSEMKPTTSLVSISDTKLYRLYAGENAIPLSYTNDSYIISTVTHDLVWFVCVFQSCNVNHYSDVIMIVMALRITAVSIVCLTIFSGADQRNHQSSALLAFVGGIHRSPADSSQKGPLTTRKTFPFGDVIMEPNQVTIDCEYVPWNILKMIPVMDLPALYSVISLVLK